MKQPFKIIPAIDIINGKLVRLTRGDYNRVTTYSDNPLDTAKMFEDNGITYLHLVDLDGAKAQSIVNYKTLELIASNTNLSIDFGGGIKSDKDVEIAFNSGAKQITGGSVAAKEPVLFTKWLSRYGANKVILGADCLEGKIATNGWLETSTLEVQEYIATYREKGVSTTICTDISKDGMLAGPSLDLYKEILDSTDIQLIASGGITSIEDLDQLREIGCSGAIIGKAIYEERITLKQLSKLC